MALIGFGKKWGDLFGQTTSPSKHFFINAIKEWRTKEHEAGRQVCEISITRVESAGTVDV